MSSSHSIGGSEITTPKLGPSQQIAFDAIRDIAKGMVPGERFPTFRALTFAAEVKSTETVHIAMQWAIVSGIAERREDGNQNRKVYYVKAGNEQASA